MNEQSSRSHFVFTLRILGVNEVGFICLANYVAFDNGIHLYFNLVIN